MARKPNPCPDCSLDRRSFIQAVGATALAGAAAPTVFNPRFAHAAPTTASAAETTVGQFYATLSEAQKQAICLPFDHSLRSRISANWHVRDLLIGDDSYSTEQRGLIDQIVRKATTPDGYERFIRQMDEDDGGIDNYSVAIFGQPGTGKFQWELTGRHLTLRVDGDSVDKAAFGGPIIYGHGEEANPKDNLFYYQTKATNEVFRSLDADQAKQALLSKAPQESAVAIQGSQGKFPGICVGQLSSDQQELVEATMKQLLAPYRQEDVDEVLAILKASDGLNKIHMAFFEQEDLDNDKVWDIWRLEGPSFVWHFRGAPHVHAYINIGMKS